MEIYEITGYRTGVARDTVNYLEPADSFQSIRNGFIYRGVLQSRQGISLFAPRLAGQTRVYMIANFILTDGSTELLVADANYLYRYDVGSRSFTQLAFGGQLLTDAYAGFGLSDQSDYISYTAYPDNLNNSRFVFTSKGMTLSASGSGIFFYDPSDGLVKDFKADGANGNASEYQEPSASIGNLQQATHVIYFNERLNFINPKTSVTTYKQGILFSGIRDSSGNGDKFNAPGSGLIQLDTYETIRGASILGQYMALNLSDSNWLLEKTTDAFNPYFPKKLPSVIGTDAPFSFAQWNSRNYSMGEDGILVMDFRESLRTDTKIPYFTRNDINQEDFDWIFGGFERLTSQFLWSYPSVEDLDTQDKVLSYNYEEDSWAIFDLPLTVIGYYEGEETIPWNQIDETIKPEWARWDTTEEIWDQIGIGKNYKVTLAGNNSGFIYQLNADYDDSFTDITAITQASSAVLTVDPSAFSVGDSVIVSGVQGMTEINNYNPEEDPTNPNYYTVTAVTPTSVTLSVDSTNFTAYTTGGTLSKPIDFEAVTIPFNPYRDKGRRCFISTIECLMDITGGYLYVDIFLDGETSPFKQNVLLQPDSTIQRDRQWVSMLVDQEADFFVFRFRQKSPSVGVKATSVRIHAEAGGQTDG